MSGRDLAFAFLAGLTVAGAARARSGSRSAAHAQALDYFDRGVSVRQSGRGVVSSRFPSWSSVRRRLQRDGFANEDHFDHLVEMFDDGDEDLSDREKIRRAWAEVEGDWDTFEGYAWSFTDPIRIWRAITADTLEALHLPPPWPPRRTRKDRQVPIPFPEPTAAQIPGSRGDRPGLRPGDGVGIWWSWDPKAAEAHWGGNHRRAFLLAGEVAYGDVNWPATFYANLSSADEREIQVKPGAPVHLLRVRDDDTGAVERQDIWVRA